MRSSALTLPYVWLFVGLWLIAAYWAQPPLARLTTSPVALILIKEREGLRLEAYKDSGGRLTIGYGHAGKVTPGMRITLAEAERLFRRDIERTERYVKSQLRVPVNQNEFSALVALAYNIGTDAFRRSSILAELNEGDRNEAADAFLLWNKIRHDDGSLIASTHLTKFRSAERALFLQQLD
jgi:lysozyme